MPVWRTLFGATLLRSILHLGLLSSKLNILIQQNERIWSSNFEFEAILIFSANDRVLIQNIGIVLVASQLNCFNGKKMSTKLSWWK